MKTPTQLEDCVAGLRTAITQSRQKLSTVKSQLTAAESAATYNSLPLGLREGITQLEEYVGTDPATLLMQSQAANFKAELEVLRQYAAATGSIWTASEAVDLSQGLTPEAKATLLAIFTAALS